MDPTIALPVRSVFLPYWSFGISLDGGHSISGVFFWLGFPNAGTPRAGMNEAKVDRAFRRKFSKSH